MFGTEVKTTVLRVWTESERVSDTTLQCAAGKILCFAQRVLCAPQAHNPHGIVDAVPRRQPRLCPISRPDTILFAYRRHANLSLVTPVLINFFA